MNNARGPGTFYWLSLLLALIALPIHFSGEGELGEAAHLKAAAIGRAAVLHTSYVPDPIAMETAHNGKILDAIGGGFTAASVICLLLARFRREGGYYLIVILLLIFSILVPAHT